MSGKDAELYKEVFDYIEEKVFALNPASFMTDFEGGMRKAIVEKWKNAKLHGCWYHYCAAVRRRIGSLYLFRLLAENDDAMEIYRQLLSLPLLPAEMIEEGYVSIKRLAREKRLFKEFRDFFTYFEGFWMQLVCPFHLHLFCFRNASMIVLISFIIQIHVYHSPFLSI